MAIELFDLAVIRQDFLAARDVYYRLLPVLSLMEGGGKYSQFVKAGCELMGHPVGPPRRPLLPASAEEVGLLKQALAAFMT